MRNRILTAIGAAALTVATFGGAAVVDANQVEGTANVEHVTATRRPRCPYKVVVVAPTTNLRCDVRSWQRMDMVGIGPLMCGDRGGNWGWRLRRCFNIDH